MKSFIAGGMVIASVALVGNAATAFDAHAATHPRSAHVSHAKAPAHVAARARSPRARAGVGARPAPYMFAGWPFSFPNMPLFNGQRVGVRTASAAPAYMFAGWPFSLPNMPPFNGHAVAARGASAAPAYVPPDDSSPAIDVSSAASDVQATVDATNAAIESMNETNAMNASMAAAEEQNEEANAAALQAELNANN